MNSGGHVIERLREEPVLPLIEGIGYARFENVTNQYLERLMSVLKCPGAELEGKERPKIRTQFLDALYKQIFKAW